MILTGETKLDFERWLHSNDVLIKDGIYDDTYLTDVFDKLPLNLQYASIIEWFDSVGIYISVKRLCTSLKFRCWYFVITNEDGDYLNKHGADESRINNDSRIEITIKAIKKANEIYNSK